MINLELLEGGDDLFLDLLNDLPVSLDIQDMPPSMSLDLMISEPLSMDLVSGGIVGDPGPRGLKGDKGDTVVVTADVDSFDPGDITLIFDNKLV